MGKPAFLDNYVLTADVLVDRIRRLMVDHPEIQDIDNPFDLFGIPGFFCADIAPSLAQAGAALRVAQRMGPLAEVAEEEKKEGKDQ